VNTGESNHFQVLLVYSDGNHLTYPTIADQSQNDTNRDMKLVKNVPQSWGA